MNILVTGGAGYIGSHTCVELLQAGHELTIMDNLCNAKADMLEIIRELTGCEFGFVQADVRDRGALDRLFGEQAFDAVIHFAALKAVSESVEKPLEYYDNNLIGAITLFEAMAQHGVKRLVFSSSATVYGLNNPVPMREEYPSSAINPYGQTKLMVERMLMDLAASDPEWSVCLLRYFNPVGAHESGRIGEDPNGIPTNLFPFIAQVAAGLRPHLNVYGNDYDTPDGTALRDYIHVTDLALGHLAALAYVGEHKGVEAVNLGTGRGVSVLDALHAFEKACGRELPYHVAPRRAGDVAVSYADPSKAKRLFGWTARYGLERMCADGWRFAKQRYSDAPTL